VRDFAIYLQGLSCVSTIQAIVVAFSGFSTVVDFRDALLIFSTTIMYTPGNDAIREVINTYIHKTKTTGIAPVPFIVFAGQTWLGMTQVALDAAGKILWPYVAHDLLALRDYTDDIGKYHTIKISQDEEITLQNGTIVSDYGVREVIQWMTKSPSGEWKVLVIEHVERLTDSAANALLKILEEPLAKRLIIATTTQKDSMLPTIFSRAVLFPFVQVSDSVIDDYIAKDEVLASYSRDFLHAFSQWTYGILERFRADSDLVTLLQTQWNALRSRSILLPHAHAAGIQINKRGYLKQFFLAMASHAVVVQRRDVALIAQKAYACSDHAISADNVFFDFLLHFYALQK
jgi:DNA polymerase III, delta subunit